MWTTTPVLTMLPETRSGFASRVGASLVEATGLSGVLLAGGRARDYVIFCFGVAERAQRSVEILRTGLKSLARSQRQAARA
jgi:predicted O-linked N-acetylglucosamine transferase (SPINDLY family)